jgi:hypothetical protein
MVGLLVLASIREACEIALAARLDAILDAGRLPVLQENASRPSRASIWRLSTFTHACTVSLQLKPTCSNIFVLALLLFIRWC